jgi:hypothetical protein
MFYARTAKATPMEVNKLRYTVNWANSMIWTRPCRCLSTGKGFAIDSEVETRPLV